MLESTENMTAEVFDAIIDGRACCKLVDETLAPQLEMEKRSDNLLNIGTLRWYSRTINGGFAIPWVNTSVWLHPVSSNRNLGGP